MRDLGTLETAAKSLKLLGCSFPLTVADRAENPLGKRASRILSIRKVSGPFNGRVLLLDSGTVLFCQERLKLRQGDWLVSMRVILNVDNLGDDGWRFGGEIRGFFVLGFQPTEAEWDALRLVLSPESCFCGLGDRHRPYFYTYDLLPLSLSRRTVSAIQAQLSLFRRRGSYRTGGAVRIGWVRGPYWQKRRHSGWFWSVRMTKKTISLLSPQGRPASRCRLLNCSAHELYSHPWDTGRPLDKFAGWISSRFGGKAFRRRLQEAPAGIAVSEPRPGRGLLKLTVGCDGGTAVVNGVPLSEKKMGIALRQAARHIGKQDAYDEFLALYRTHSLGEIEAMRHPQGSISLHIPGRGTVRLRLEAVQREGQWLLSLEGTVFQKMLSRLNAAPLHIGADPLRQDEGWQEVERLAIPREVLLGALRRRIVEMNKADRKARQLLCKLSAQYPDRVRVLDGREPRVIVKGKLRDYLVICADGNVQVRGHPNGEHFCINDREVPPCQIDGLISRMMSLLNDESLTGEIFTLEGRA